MSEAFSPLGKMDVLGSLDRAVEHTKRVLFSPFSVGIWLRFGFIVFLEHMLQGGGGGSVRAPFHHDMGRSLEISRGINEAVDWIAAHFAVMVVLGGMVLVFMLALGVLFLWLSSRGMMMLVRAVALNDPRIGENWHTTARPAFSIFLFRIVVAVVLTFVSLTVLAFGVVEVIALARAETSSIATYFLSLLPFILILVALGLVAWAIRSLLRNFVAPLMYQFDLSCLEGWRRFFAVAGGNIGPLILLYVIRFAYHIAFGIAAVFVGCCTCCIGFLPVIAQTIFAPFHVFDRAYTLYAIESLGPDFQIIRPPLPPPETPLDIPAAPEQP